MNTFIRLLEKLVFLAAGLVIIFLAMYSKSYAKPIDATDIAVQQSLPAAEVIVVN